MKRCPYLLTLAVLATASIAAPSTTHAQDKPTADPTPVRVSFDECQEGDSTCGGWAGDYRFEAHSGDKVLVISPRDATDAGISWLIDRPTGNGVGSVISIALRTDSLVNDFSVAVSSGGEEWSIDVAIGTSSWHRVLIPFGWSNKADAELHIRSRGAACGVAGCGRLLIDDVEIRSMDEYANVGLQLANACPEGQFANLGLSENDCEPLHVRAADMLDPALDSLLAARGIDRTVFEVDDQSPLGFDHASFDKERTAGERDVDVDQCTVAAINHAIAEHAGAGVGVIRLPACTFDLTGSILIEQAAGIVLQGHGVGRTVLRHDPSGRPGPAIRVRRSQNVIVRDLSLDLANADYSNIEINLASNVLVERVSIRDPGSSAIRSAKSERVTVRYSAVLGGPKIFSDPGCQGHHFYSTLPSSSDRDGDGKGSTAECEALFGSDLEPGVAWSASYAAYSNVGVGNSFATHNSAGEIAGNRFIETIGNKLPNSTLYWIHNNAFISNPEKPGRVAVLRDSDDGIVDRFTTHVAVYRNRFVNAAESPLRMLPWYGVVAGNEFVNTNPRIRVGRFTMTCAGSAELSLLDSTGQRKGRIIEPTAGSVCDLTDMGTIWSRSGVSPP